METRCQYSKLTIPGTRHHAAIAASYAESVAQMLGLRKRDIEDIRQSTERVVAWAIDYSQAEDEKIVVEVSCEVIPEGFKITVCDRGVPFEPPLLKNDESSDLSSVYRLKGQMDEMVFNNLGPGGKEFVLIKYSQPGLITDHFNACELESTTTASQSVPTRDVNVTVRPMMPGEAIEVSKCVYRGYGYSYPHEQIYYPAKLVELNRNKRIFSAVGVSGDGEVIGHCALMNKRDESFIAEMGLGVVKPEYRAKGCFNKLVGFLIEKAQSRQLKGLYVRAVAVHRYSQRTAARFALRETALLLAYIPPTVDFRHMGASRSRRATAFTCFRYLGAPTRPLVYPPARHRDMIVGLYEHLGVKPLVKSPAAQEKTALEVDSRVRIKVENSIGYACIIVENYGQNIVAEISQNMTELCLNKIEVLNLYLDLSDPRTGSVSGSMEELGFFFSGILPGGMPNGSDALIFQYLNSIPADCDAIQTHSEMAKTLLAYVCREYEGSLPKPLVRCG